jgi:hypothetical protein
MKKKAVIISAAILTVLVLLLVYINYIFDMKNTRYTQKLRDYSYFIKTVRNEHYVEYDDKFKIQIWSLFSLWKPSKLISVSVSIADVYWEEKDEYINIDLNIEENLTGELRYSISYRSNPMIIRTYNADRVAKDETMSVKLQGNFDIDDNILPEYEEFIRDNSEEIDKLFQRALFYWDIPSMSFQQEG